MIGAYSPVARTIELARQDIAPVFMAVSFVGSNALAEELGAGGEGVYVTQVTPFPEDTSIPVVAAYQAALKAVEPNGAPGFVSLEGYLAGRLAIEGLERCGQDLTRQCFLDAINNAGMMDMGGLNLQFGPGDNQGSDAVFLTRLGSDGKFSQATRLGGEQ